jgi:hypothetical protein
MPNTETISRIAKILARATSPEPSEAEAAIEGAYKRMIRDRVTITDLLSLPVVELYQETLVRLIFVILRNQTNLSPQERRKAFEDYMVLITERFATVVDGTNGYTSSNSSSEHKQNPKGASRPSDDGPEKKPEQTKNTKSNDRGTRRADAAHEGDHWLKSIFFSKLGWFVFAVAFIGLGGYFLSNDGGRNTDQTSRTEVRQPLPSQSSNDLSAIRNPASSAVSAAFLNLAPPVPWFQDVESEQAYRRWLGKMLFRLREQIPDFDTRKEFLQTVWYESRRAGLDVSLVLGLIETLSDFKKFYVSETGARGYMSVPSEWTVKIGDGDAVRLFHMQTNLRYGCLVMRHYLDFRRGDIHAALLDYYGGSLGLDRNDPRVLELESQFFQNQTKWMFEGQGSSPLSKVK